MAVVKKGPSPTGDIFALIGAIIQGTPKLPGASCTNGHRELFLADNPDVEACQAICQLCPCLQPCRDWALTQDNALTGVVAGELRAYSPLVPKRPQIRKPRPRIRNPKTDDDAA
jgi:hypothetical protein